MVLASIIAAYDTLGTTSAATKAALVTLLALGARPTFPVDVTADADYNNVVTSQSTYDAAWTTANNAYLTALTAQKAQELVVTALMPKNQWIRCTGLANWGTAATQYISCPLVQTTSANGCPLYSINTVATLPINAYPSLT